MSRTLFRDYFAPCPAGFIETTEHPLGPMYAGSRTFRTQDGLVVIFSNDHVPGEQSYSHVSLSRKARLPSYEDVQRVRLAFIGDDVECVQVFPRKEDYVNMHPFCLHLWAGAQREIMTGRPHARPKNRDG